MIKKKKTKSKPWNKNLFLKHSIVHQTEKAVLLRMPSNCEFEGCVFWMPKKLIKVENEEQGLFSFTYSDEWIFTLKHPRMNTEEHVLACEMKEIYF